MLIPAAAVSRAPAPEQNLLQQWSGIQTSGDRQARKDWWRSLEPDRLNAFIDAGAEPGIADDRGWTPLHSAARYNPDPDILLALITAGAVLDARDRAGNTPLHWAAAENPNAAIVAALIAAGANVNARDRFGWLPIHTAADRNPNPAVIGALLAAGAKRNRRAYYVLFRPAFLVRRNANMSEEDRKSALALLRGVR